MPLNDGFVYREQLAAPAGQSALEYLSAKYPRASAAEWSARFARGEVTLNGARATGSERLAAGQWLCWHRPPWDEPERPESFEVLFEDEHLLAVVKESGLPTLPSGAFLKHTLLELVRSRYPEASPLHRLGRATSGLVLFSRTRAAASVLSSAWRERSVEKRYRGLSAGVAAQDRYEIDAKIGLVPHPLLGEVHGYSPTGKHARSTAVVLERRASSTLFEVNIQTGRPEQIRIHLAFIGHPLAGDPMFAAGGLPLAESPGLPGDGGYLLHAETLSFAHPISGEAMRLVCRPPPALRTAAER